MVAWACCWWLLLYSAILRSRADSLRLHVILHEWLVCFYSVFSISTEVMYLQRWHGWCHMKLLPSQCVLCTPYSHAPCHFTQSHLRKVRAYNLAVTCHPRFWQNDWGLLHATVVTQGWNGYQNKSQHRKLTLEKKVLLPLLQGFEPTTFWSWVQRSNHWGIPAPQVRAYLTKSDILMSHGTVYIQCIVLGWCTVQHDYLFSGENLLLLIMKIVVDLCLFSTD